MTGKAGKPLRFTSVHLENWRNFTQATVALQQRVFMVGPNAAGKSNLLDVFRFLHDLVAVGGGFQETVGKRGGVSRLRSLAARRHPDVVVQVQIGNDEDPAAWAYDCLLYTSDAADDLLCVDLGGRRIIKKKKKKK